MNIDEFRKVFSEYRCFAVKEAEAFKDSSIVSDRLLELYKEFYSKERKMADLVIAE